MVQVTRNFIIPLLVIGITFILLLRLFSSNLSSSPATSIPDKSHTNDSTGVELSIDSNALRSICQSVEVIQSEVGVPGIIHGFDCYSAELDLEIAFRESSSKATLLSSLRAWLYTPENQFHYILSKGWYLIATKTGRTKVEELKLTDGSFISLADFNGPNREITEEEFCAISMGVMLEDQIIRNVPFPEELSAPHKEALLASLTNQGTVSELQTTDASLPKYRIVLGKLVKDVNILCATTPNFFG